VNVPGATAKHAIIRDGCRAAHGDLGAFDEAARRLREYEQLLWGWRSTPGVQFHLVLSVERPRTE
jgi:hypothetical protein